MSLQRLGDVTIFLVAEGGRTGEFVATGVLTQNRIVFVRPPYSLELSRQAPDVPDSSVELALRVGLVDPDLQLPVVLDVDRYFASRVEGADPLVALQLPDTPAPVRSFGQEPDRATLAREAARLLAEDPPHVPGQVAGPLFFASGKPWWCSIFPNAGGCA